MQTRIMAIINTSPESFSGDGSSEETSIRQRINTALRAGADIIDIGGQSTRPGATLLTTREELRRVIPAVLLARRLTNLPVSVDTFIPQVAEAAATAGASIINSTFKAASEVLVAIAVEKNCKVVIMHSRGTPESMAARISYPGGVLATVAGFLRERAAKAVAAGLPPGHIIIDPGIGFAKTPAQCFMLTRHLADLKGIGYPVLYGASLKSFLGWGLTDPAPSPRPTERRADATNSIQTFAMLQGADIVRVHDVRAASDARRVVECVFGSTETVLPRQREVQDGTN